MRYMFITGNPEVARYVESCGVHRIFSDMEVLGKAQRQGHLNTHRAAHTLDDVARLRDSISIAELMVRVNPLHSGSQVEVDALMSIGIDRIMLPMFTSPEQVASFQDIVGGRVPITFLVETAASLVRLEPCVKLMQKDDQVHFGLNDLSIDMGLDFLFEPMAAGLFDFAAILLGNLGIPFGIGGIAKIGAGRLPAEYVIGEHVRLGSEYVILSRAFRGGEDDLPEMLASINFQEELKGIQILEEKWRQASHDELVENRNRLAALVFEISVDTRNAQFKV